MRIFISIIFLSLTFTQERDLWGCMDEDALNYDPYAIFCCSSCCIYEQEDAQIVINEINYNPALSLGQEDSDYEFIELYNRGESDVNLEGWYFNEGSSSSCYSFGHVVIESDGYLVLARNTQTYPGSIEMPGEYLSNSGATIILRDAHYNIVDQVTYGDSCDDVNHPSTCWPTNADAGGSTLELINPDLDNSLASSWQDSFIVPGGTPGYANSSDDGNIFGCMDESACNFNPEATIDNGTCQYPEDNYDCEGNCIVEVDECGECGGDGIADGECDCDGNVDLGCGCGEAGPSGCDETCGSTLEFDECGECGGDGVADGFCDCDGNVLDCAGVCAGNSVVDECGECGGSIDDESLCPVSGFSLSLDNYDVNNNSVDVILNNESGVAGFQFNISGLNISSISFLDSGDFSVYSSESTIIGFSMSGDVLSAANRPILSIDFTQDYDLEFCISDAILSGPNGQSLDVLTGDCLSAAGCTDFEACNYGAYQYSCSDCCNYGEQYWLDTDGDGLGFANDELLFCEDPGIPWVQNHGDEFPNCFSNIVDGCDVCDGDNSSCSGCTDENAFNYNCLNGNWPTTATFGCSEDVLISDDSCLYPPEGFEFNQSTKQAFYKFIDGEFNGEPLVFMGSWIGAFRDGQCVGSWPWVGEFTTVPVMGFDGQEYSEGYMIEGENPEFYVYDPILDDSFNATLSDNYEWIDLEIYHVDLISVEVDCEGVAGGDQVYDECGVCGGDGFIDNCLGNNSCDEMDCFGVCGGEEVCESYSSSWSDYGFFLGDVNVDYQTNVLDITNQVNFILEYDDPNLYEFWASDINENSELNVVDIVYLSSHILGLLARTVDDAEAYVDNNTLYISGSVGGVQFSGGELISEVNSDDIVQSNNGTTIIYNLNGNLNTDLFEFSTLPNNIIVASQDGRELDVEIVSEFSVSAFPNPFNPVTSIEFSIPEDRNVAISIYDIQGREIAQLSNQYYSAGLHKVLWNAEDYSSGLYFARIVSGAYVNTQRLILSK